MLIAVNTLLKSQGMQGAGIKKRRRLFVGGLHVHELPQCERPYTHQGFLHEWWHLLCLILSLCLCLQQVDWMHSSLH